MTAGLTYCYGNRPLTHDNTRGEKKREEEAEKSRKRRHSDTESSVISGFTVGSSSEDTEGDSVSNSTFSSTSIRRGKKTKKGKRAERLRPSWIKKRKEERQNLRKAQLRD